jgi:rhodanese-related sulfurtransferase
MYRNVTPKEAKELVDNEGYTYIDVRSEQGFENGHPVGALNAPLMHLRPGVGMTPNPRFVEVMEANFPKDARLVLACKAGGRSVRACQILAAAGYRDLVNMDGGYEGRLDPLGRLAQPGWTQEGLPTTTDIPDGSSYASLAAKA